MFDAGILSLHFAGDSRVKEYFDKVAEQREQGLITDINLAEYYYKTCRKLGKQTADLRYLMLKASRLRTVTDEELTRLAGLEKCKQKLDLSLADCFALALAKRERGLLLTTDKELGKTGDVQVKLFKV